MSKTNPDSIARSGLVMIGLGVLFLTVIAYHHLDMVAIGIIFGVVAILFGMFVFVLGLCQAASEDDSVRIEHIVAAATVVNGAVVYLPQPNRHDNIIRALADVIPKEHWPIGDHQGFITNTGRYVSREEGWKIAERAHQLIFTDGMPHGTLYSENMW